MVHQTPVASPDNIDVDISEARSHTLEHAGSADADVENHGDTTPPVFGLESISSTNIVDSAYTDTLDVADNVVAYSTSVVDDAHRSVTNVIPQASTGEANTDPAENQADTSSIDDTTVHASSRRIDSTVKTSHVPRGSSQTSHQRIPTPVETSHVSRGSSQTSHQRIPTPVAVKEVGASLPDSTPSRRSSRKKQSTFSSDFEYYALGSMKIEIKPETTLSYKPRQATSDAQDDDSDGSSESDDDIDDDKMKNIAKKKIVEKKHKGKVSEVGDSEEDETDREVKSDKGKVKVAAKKKTQKFSTIIKGSKKKVKREKEESETDEDSGEDVNENRVIPKLLKGHKRKKDDGFVKASKKMKVASDQEDESSDEEESTPISLLKAKLKEESTPISQLKDKLKEESIPISKLKAELKEESIPISKLKAKLKDSDPLTQHKKEASNSASPAKIKSAEDLDAFSLLQAQIRLKREAKSSHMARPETNVSNDAGSTKTHPSSPGSSGCSHRHKLKHAGSSLKKSEKGILGKIGVSKSDGMRGDSPKHPKERNAAGDGVKKEVRYITKIKVIRKPDGTIIKKKVLVPEREIHRLEENKIRKQNSPEKSEGKKVTKLENTKTDSHQKHAVASGHLSAMKHNGRLDSDGFQKKKSHQFPSKDGSTGLKHKHGLKAKVEHDRKDGRPALSVDDLLKRGVLHKKKHHQPFGNKNLPKPAVKDRKPETVKDATKTEHENKESKVHQKGNKSEIKNSKGHRSSHVDKQGRDRSRSSESSKSRRKSMEAGKRKPDKHAEVEQDDSPPVLIPASSLSKPKHRHHKVEQEVPVDITMNDLFKPDTHAQDLLNKEEIQDNDVQSGVEPDRVYNILIEHQYSKPASPVVTSQDGQVGDSVITGGEDDIESISHAQAVVMDANLPDQFLEESDELAANDTENFQDTWPTTMEELQHLVERRDTADRSSILESLGSELQESGTEFLIVGQVEVGRVPALLREERQSMQEVAGSESEKADGASTPERDEEIGDNSGEEPNFEDDEKDIDWEPNDTDTLYCICRKPHNNRFMICCDKCEEWFHGTCVGISRARGQEMEDNEEEYICPFCAKGDPDLTLETAVLSLKSPEKMKSQLLQKCVGRRCSKAPRPGSVYCSNECVMSHAQEALKTIREEQMKKKISEKQPSTHSKSSSSSTPKTLPAKSSSAADTVEVIERETGKLLTGSSAPTQKGLHRWLEQHPTFEVVLPHKHRSKSSSSKDKQSRSDRDKTSSADRDRQKSDKDRKRAETEKRDHTSSKDSSRQSEAEKQQNVNSQTSDGSRIDDRRGDGQKQIRVNVQTALGDCLSARALEDDDIMLSSNEIKSLALTIEEELFSLFNDTGHKYRTKYRSLVFNIKDQKNKGLFRKILTGKIKPYQLVQMSTEELASKELAMWREQASKHQLDMIQKTEQQALKESAAAKHVRKKTHKGEVEVEEEDLSVLETRLEEKKDPEPDIQEEQPQVPVIDTTDQHRAHLFDLNCKVCTGKIVPGRVEQAMKAAPEKPATITFEQPEEKKPVQSQEEKDDYEKAEEIVKEAFRTMQKMEKSVSSLPKIVSSSPAVESVTPPLSPKLVSSRRESSSSSASSMSSSSTRRAVVVRSPDSALQSGLEAKSKFTPTGPMLWKGFMSMLDVAKFFTSAYSVSGPTDHITIPDTINILGRISPEQMWDYLSKIRQAGSKDLTVVRFIPGNDDQKVAYIHLYSYLNSRSRCGVAASTNKQIKDFYIIPLASHSKIPLTLLPFDGPGLEENRPHMLIGVLVRQKGKQAIDTPDAGNVGKSGTSVKSGSQSSSVSRSGSSSSSGKPVSHRSTASSSTKLVTPVVSRDPRLAKLAAREASPKVSPAESTIYVTSTSADTTEALVEEYEPEYVPMPINTK
ncbi:unnamed protein product, partial [Candidula unifasciata]